MPMGSHPAGSDPRPSRRLGLSLFLLLLAFLPDGVSGNSGGVPGEAATGVVVEGNVPFARESLGEIRALAPDRVPSRDVNRAIPFRRNPRHSGTTLQANGPFPANASGTRLSSAPAGMSAPVLDNSFAGLGNPPRSAGDVIPPDTMGAAGPNHLVSLLNSEFGVFDKATGAILDKTTLKAFWASLGPGTGQPANFPFDPRILFDQHSGRFVAVTLGGQSATDSWVMVAVSSTANPLDNWYKWAIDADLDNNAQLYYNWADFPGLGVDASNVYITANMFSNTGYQYSKVWVIPKPQLLSGTNPITWTEFRAPPGSNFAMQPAHTFGSAAAEYFVFEGSVPNHLLLAKIDNVTGKPVWHYPASVAVALYTTSFALPGAPQDNNSNTIDTADTRLLSNAVYRNGYLWATHHVAVSGKVEVAWYRLDPVAGTVASQGRINDPSRWYYYPSIAVNQDNVAAIGFSGSSPTEYAGAYYTVIRPPHVAAEPVSLLKAGEAPYYKTLGGPENRWGDFSATVVDPTDDLTFWTLQEYAWTPDPLDSSRSRWGTWWGSFRASATTPPGVAPPGNLTASLAGHLTVQLTWTDLSTGETGYVVERKEGASGTYGLLTSPPLPANSVAYTDTAGLSPGKTYYYLVGAVGSSGTAYSAEVSVTTPASSGGDGGGGCLTLSGPSKGGDPISETFSIAILLSPIAAIGARKRIRQLRGRRPLGHPSC